MDLQYLTRRMTEERQRAADAENAAARQAHMEMAEYYATRIGRLPDSSEGPGLQAMTA